MFTSPCVYLTIITEPWATKYKFKNNANATQRNIARIISTVRFASMAGRTTEVTIISC